MVLYLHPQSTSKNAQNCKGTLAQLVEQWTENPCVAGSIPARTTRPSTQVAPARETMIDVGCRLSDCEGSNVKEGGVIVIS